MGSFDNSLGQNEHPSRNDVQALGSGSISLASVETEEVCHDQFQGGGDVNQIKAAGAECGSVFLRERKCESEHGSMVNGDDLETAKGDVGGEVLPKQAAAKPQSKPSAAKPSKDDKKK